ncbi:MAG: VCBS repeat-containing protein, partial [Hymenobacter sp.]
KDGKRDLAFVNQSINSITVFLGNGMGMFPVQTNFSVGTAPIDLVLADLNGDGTTDLAVTNNSDASVGILLGNGAGNFDSQITYASVDHPSAIEVGDFNGDGKPDLAVTNNFSGTATIGILLGQGTGVPKTNITYSAGEFISGIASADYNGDGKDDLVFVGQVSTYLNILLSVPCP